MKTAALLTLIANAGLRILADLHFPTKLSDVTFEALIEDFDKTYGKKVSKMASRVCFGTFSQHEGENIDEFIAELQHASMDCGFGDQLESRLKDQFVIGLRSDHIKKKLLEDEDRDLADILKKARALELVDREHSSSKSVLTHSDTQHIRSSRSPQRNEVHTRNHAIQQKSASLNANKASGVSCHRCGRRGHQPEQCFYLTRNLTCHKCGNVGHNARMCRYDTQDKPQDSSKSASKNWRAETANNDPSKSGSQSRCRSPSYHIDDIEAQDNSDASNHVDDFTSSSIMMVHSIENVLPITYKVEVNGCPISMELDSGSCYILLNSKHWKQLGQPELAKGPELRDVSRNSIPVLGMAYVEVRLKEQLKRLRVVFIDRPDTASLIGREWIAEFNLLTVQQATFQVDNPQVTSRTPLNLGNLLDEFKDLFENSNLPPIKGFKAHLHVRPDAQFKLVKPRPVPYALRSKI